MERARTVKVEPSRLQKPIVEKAVLIVPELLLMASAIRAKCSKNFTARSS